MAKENTVQSKASAPTTEVDEQPILLVSDSEYADFVTTVAYVTLHMQKTDAHELAIFFRSWINENPEYKVQFPDRWEMIGNMYSIVCWVSLAQQPKTVLTEQFKTGLASLFKADELLHLPDDVHFVGDICADEVRGALIQIEDLIERDEMKKVLIVEIANNTEVITTEQFFDDIREVPATTAMWIKQYEEYAIKRYNNTVIDGFLRNNENARKVSSATKKKLKAFLQMFNRFHVSSFTPEGLENPLYVDREDGVTEELDFGEIKEYSKDSKEKFIKNMKAIKQLYEESGIKVPSTMDWLDSKMQERPPVQLPAKGALSDIGGGPAIDNMEGPDHFTEQDALDIQQNAALIDELVHSNVDYEAQAQQLITRMQLVFASSDIEVAVKQLIVSVLRGLRDTMELRTYLEQQKFAAEQIDQVIAVLRAAIYRRAEAVVESSPTTPVIPAGKAADTTGTDAVTGSSAGSMNAAATETQPKHSFLPKLRRARVAKKPLIDDVKLQQSMVMGPIDELRAMDVLEFRRLSDNPAAAAQKIKTKIDLLAEESVSKQAEGVEAWRGSIINGLYIAIGNESIGSGKSVAEVIAEWKAAGKSVITEDEFSAIADINQQLRF